MRFVIFAAALALIACSKPPQQQRQTAATTTTTVSTTAPAVKGVGGAEAAVLSTPTATAPVINQQFMIGTWGDNGDCSKDIIINDDGSFTSYNGGDGQWSLNGDTLSLVGKNGTFDLRLAFIDQNTLRITNPDGSVGTSQRCD